METFMKTFDAEINKIPDWLMGAIFGGLVYFLLRLTYSILPFMPFDISRGLSSSLLRSFWLVGELFGDLIGVNPIIAGSIPYLFIGGVMGALNKRGRIVFLLFLLVLALVPFAVVLYFIFSILWVVSHY